MQVNLSTSSSDRSAQQRRQVKRFLRHGLLWLGVLVLCDQLIGRIMRELYFMQTSGPLAETTQLFTQVQADALILGSSRGRRNYNPQVFADTLGISVYNGGHDGQTLFYEQAVIRRVLQRYTPRLVIIDLNPEEMYYREVHYDRLNVLAPYYRDFPELRSIYLLRSVRDGTWEPGRWWVQPARPGQTSWENFWFRLHAMEERLLPVTTERIKMLSAIYPYNSYALDIAAGIFLNRKSHSGFKPLKGKVSEAKARELLRQNAALRNQPGKRVDEHKVAALEEIISSLKQRGSAVVIAMSPALAPFAIEPSYEVIRTICQRHEIPFKDYSQDKRYADWSYFHDNHMNLTGATLYSAHLASDIKHIFYPQLLAQYGQKMD